MFMLFVDMLDTRQHTQAETWYLSLGYVSHICIILQHRLTHYICSPGTQMLIWLHHPAHICLHSVAFLWVTFSSEETPVGQSRAALTVQRGRSLAAWTSLGFRSPKKIFTTSRPFSFSGSAGNTTSHCGYLKSLKISYKDNSPSIRWQALLFFSVYFTLKL